VLDYFGSVVNTASRLEHQCGGGEAIISQAVLADPEAREALAGRDVSADSATLRGLGEPVRFVRVGANRPADGLSTTASDAPS
jgi:class 3 adenylate cyclase